MRKSGIVEVETEQGIMFWNTMYITIVVAMSSIQNVRAALNALITGSYNWTMSAARYNHENVVLTTDGKLVKPFLKEFRSLWDSMQPYSR